MGGGAAVSLDVDTHWAEMTGKEGSIARSIAFQAKGDIEIVEELVSLELIF